MKWYHRLKIWWWNKQAYRLINDYAYWCMRTSNRRLGLEEGEPDKARIQRDAIKQKMDDLHDKRNAYAFKHNLKPHPNTPDNWRARYEQESNGRSNDVGE